MKKKKRTRSSGKPLTPTQRAQHELKKADERRRRGFKGFSRPGRRQEVMDGASGASMATRSASRSQIKRKKKSTKKRKSY